MEVEFITIPKRVPVKVYPSFIGKVAIVDDLPVNERLKIGCQLRKRGFRLIYEYTDNKVAKYMESLCKFGRDYEGADLDDLELDVYLRCENPHPILGCAFLYYGDATVYQIDSSVAFGAKLPNGRFVWYDGVENVFTSELPPGKLLNNVEGRIWVKLAMNDDLTTYDRYYVMLDVIGRKFGVRLYVDPTGNVISSEVYT